MSIHSAKDTIREARTKAGLTQDALSEGICSVQALSRIETGICGVSPATFYALMERAGAPCSRYPVFANRDDFACFYALKKARFHLDCWQLAPAYEELQTVEDKGWADNKLYHQEWLLLHCRLQFRSYCCDHVQNHETLLSALKLTRPSIDLTDFYHLFLSQNEIQLLTDIAHEALYLQQPELCSQILAQLDRYLDTANFPYLEQERLQAEHAIVHVKYLLAEESYEAALEIADHNRQKMVMNVDRGRLFELTFLTGLCLHCLKDLEKAATHIKAAYYSAHAIGSYYAEACRTYLIQNTDFPLSDYMQEFPALTPVSFPAKQPSVNINFSNGIYDANDKNAYTLGMLIRDKRMEQNLSLQIVCQGLCSRSQLSKIESDLLKPGIALAEALLQRLGITERIFTFWGNEKEAKLYELKFKLIHSSLLPQESFMEYLQEMDSLIEEKDILYKQEYLSSKALRIDSPNEQIDELMSALHCTLPDFDIYRIHDYRLSWGELTILNCIANAYRRTDQANLGGIYFYHVEKYLKTINPDILLHAQIFPIAAKIYCRTLYVQKQYESILKLYKQPTMWLLPYTPNAYMSFLFYYSQALGECFQTDDAVKYAIYSKNLNMLLGYPENVDALKRYFKEDFSIELND